MQVELDGGESSTRYNRDQHLDNLNSLAVHKPQGSSCNPFALSFFLDCSELRIVLSIAYYLLNAIRNGPPCPKFVSMV
jgi:hypothetical protein